MTATNTNKGLLGPVALGVLLACAASAGAQERVTPIIEPDVPWYVGAQQAFTHDSNVRRSPDASKESDTISTTSLLGGVDLRLGRQRLRADLEARHEEFKDLDDLNNDGYRANGRLDWETIGRLSGNVDVFSSRELVRGDIITAAGSAGRTMQQLNSASFTGRLGAAALLSIEGRVGYQDVNYSSTGAVDVDLFDSHQTFGSLGVLYRPSGLLTLGVAARVTNGKYSNVSPADDFDRKDIDFTATWVPSGISTVSARLSATEEDHSANPGRDLSGVTGALRWDWRPTGKLRFITDLARDTGTQIQFSQLLLPGTDQFLSVAAPESTTTNTVRLRALYDLTAKIRLDGLLSHVERSFDTLAGDRTTLASLGVRWLPTRAIGVGCSVAWQSRSSSDAGREFDANITSCFASFVLQG
jgi:hypothetical protein